MKNNYQEGGKVRISGKWRKISETYNPTAGFWKVEGMGTTLATLDFDEIVEAYEPPQSEAYEWITANQLFESIRTNAIRWDKNADKVNQYLTETYGDPTVRTYNGEEPEDYGLEPSSVVLFWDEECWSGECWREEHFRGLEYGDKWRKQPPAPTE